MDNDSEDANIASFPQVFQSENDDNIKGGSSCIPSTLVDGENDIASKVDGRTSCGFNIKDLNHHQVSKLEFYTPEEADRFYWNYGRQNGFDVRRYHKKTVRGVVRNVEWVCSRAGFKQSHKHPIQLKRQPRSEMRCGCKARFRIAHDPHDDIYRVTNFISIHNHPLESAETAHRLRCKRYIRTSKKDLLSAMTSSGISPSNAMDYLEYSAGGAGKVAFRRKDGYNYLNKERMRMIKEGYVNTALALLEGMKFFDKDLIFEYIVDEDQTLTRLFWTDGLSRAEFDLFGDVLIFDSTYKTNAYRFPLVVLSGVNNHYNTCVVGAALLYNETVETYQWLLQNFRNAMGGKMPISVLTDQDAAMSVAIEMEFPLAKHRICSWHLERSAMTNTHIPVFTREMGRILKKRCSIEEFHTSWHSLIEKYGLGEHPWVVDIFKKKELWAEAYFRGHFFGMMRSTQRSESINAFLKLFLKQRMKLTELLKQYFLWIQKLRATYFQNQADSEKSTPSLTK